MSSLTLHTIPAGTRGFDCNTPLTHAQAVAFRGHGYQFAIRYIGRMANKPHDLSENEAAGIMAAGLGLILVQHVESAESWEPDPVKGARYGEFAATAMHGLKLPANTPVWCDLEGVNLSVPKSDIIGFCNAWYDQAVGGAADPGLYVGWHAGLTPEQLYQRLKFKRYWSAYNLNRDQFPAVRGVQLKQGVADHDDRPEGITFEIDTNTVVMDALGGLPTCVSTGNFGQL